MKLKALSIGLLSFAAAAAAAANTTPVAIDARAVVQLLDTRGFVAIHELERQHGVWTAEGTTLNGQLVYILVDEAGLNVHAIGPYAEGALSIAELTRLLTAAGYRSLRDFYFDDGFWEVEATNQRGQRVELIVHPVTGRVLSETLYGMPPSNAGFLSSAEVIARLLARGYTHVRPTEFDDGKWEVYARNPGGQWVELLVHGRTGEILREERD